MTKKSRCSPGCCKVAALVTIDARGQMVLPKEIRNKAKIKAGDKLAIITWESTEKMGGICLVKADELNETAKDLLGPTIKRTTK